MTSRKRNAFTKAHIPQVRGPKWVGLSTILTLEDKLRLFSLWGYAPHPAQQEVHASRARFKVLANGRRWGKTKLAASEALAHAILGGHVRLAAPTYKLVKACWDEVVDYVQNSEVSTLVKSFSSREGSQFIALATGGIIDARSTSDPKSLVSIASDLFVFDEAALEPSEEAWLRRAWPTLIDRKGGAILCSTPNGLNWFYAEWLKGIEGGNPDYKSFRFPSWTNPMPTLQEEIDSWRQNMPESYFKQEVGAEFLAEASSVFWGIDEVAVSKWLDQGEPGVPYVIAIDPAKVNDYTAIVVMDARSRAVVHLGRHQNEPYPILVERTQELVLRFSGASIVVDQTNNAAFVDQLVKDCPGVRVVGVSFTNASKMSMVSAMALAIQQKAMAVLSPQQEERYQRALAQVALEELRAFRYDRTPAGTLRAKAPEGFHDDFVTAHMLALDQCLFTTTGTPAIVKRGL